MLKSNPCRTYMYPGYCLHLSPNAVSWYCTVGAWSRTLMVYEGLCVMSSNMAAWWDIFVHKCMDPSSTVLFSLIKWLLFPSIFYCVCDRDIRDCVYEILHCNHFIILSNATLSLPELLDFLPQEKQQIPRAAAFPKPGRLLCISFTGKSRNRYNRWLHGFPIANITTARFPLGNQLKVSSRKNMCQNFLVGNLLKISLDWFLEYLSDEKIIGPCISLEFPSWEIQEYWQCLPTN